jgi:hypothetical protein
MLILGGLQGGVRFSGAFSLGKVTIELGKMVSSLGKMDI